MKILAILLILLAGRLHGADEELILSIKAGDDTYIASLCLKSDKVTKVSDLPFEASAKKEPKVDHTMRDIVWINGKVSVWNGSWKSRISTYDPANGSWTHRKVPGHNTGSGGLYGGLCAVGSTLYASDVAVGATPDPSGILIAGSTSHRRVLEDQNTGDVSSNGKSLYFLFRDHPKEFGDIYYHHVCQMDLLDEKCPPIIVHSSEPLYAIAVSDAGEVFMADKAGILLRYKKWGDPAPDKRLRFMQGDVPTIITDIDISSRGTIALGTFAGTVLLTNTELENPSHMAVTEAQAHGHTVFTCFRESVPDAKPKAKPKKKEGAEEPVGPAMIALTK